MPIFESWSEENSQLVKAFFGRPARLLTAAWVLDQDGAAFFQQSASDALRDASETPSATRAALEQFSAFGMLNSFPDGRRRYYVQVDNPFWDAYGALAKACGIVVTRERDRENQL
jgi:hypothetical protein